jgi:hypothetical protein
MKSSANSILIGFDGKCPKFRHSFELRGFLPLIPAIDPAHGWDNARIIEKYHLG